MLRHLSWNSKGNMFTCALINWPRKVQPTQSTVFYHALSKVEETTTRIARCGRANRLSFISGERSLLLGSYNDFIVRRQAFPLSNAIQILPGYIRDAQMALFPFIFAFFARLWPPERIQLHHLFCNAEEGVFMSMRSGKRRREGRMFVKFSYN